MRPLTEMSRWRIWPCIRAGKPFWIRTPPPGTSAQRTAVRNTAATALLDAAQRDLAAQGVPLLGVDCETLNPPAFRCWSKRFAPFTYSFVRRLDERCALHKD